MAKLPRLTATTVPSDVSSAEIDGFVRSYLATAKAAAGGAVNPGLYELNMPALEAAAPDIIISQGLCDVCAVASGDVEDALCSLTSCPRMVATAL